jgi:hypothetical protein
MKTCPMCNKTTIYAHQYDLLSYPIQRPYSCSYCNHRWLEPVYEAVSTHPVNLATALQYSPPGPVVLSPQLREQVQKLLNENDRFRALLAKLRDEAFELCPCGTPGCGEARSPLQGEIDDALMGIVRVKAASEQCVTTPAVRLEIKEIKKIVWFARGGEVLHSGPYNSQVDAIKALKLRHSGTLPNSAFVWPEEVDIGVKTQEPGA